MHFCEAWASTDTAFMWMVNAHGSVELPRKVPVDAGHVPAARAIAGARHATPSTATAEESGGDGSRPAAVAHHCPQRCTWAAETEAA
eukprot:10090960-Alexandrium_andersonii.AAC.1